MSTDWNEARRAVDRIVEEVALAEDVMTPLFSIAGRPTEVHVDRNALLIAYRTYSRPFRSAWVELDIEALSLAGSSAFENLVRMVATNCARQCKAEQ